MYLSAKRVVRTFGSFFLILAIVLWSAFFFVNSLTAVAVELVEKALSRYNNFTGKIALQNFAEDKILSTSSEFTRNGFALFGIAFAYYSCISDSLISCFYFVFCVTKSVCHSFDSDKVVESYFFRKH